ncbi:hypothetical protein TBR22_A12180 [Luteitalea sp. TBR-22]|uniref:PEP-CTERM sorting domain-containing protein n=1 Tax=Luteitalea sp. TBR-22 TaxID=2802971 RepID=UPI001AF9EB62|nr:PEP-CTERM sorting domain-containing protein [Luteitalea sp. TBR-22]BCS32014.1 hypothetical protein TBR22_A12180 [Luteitalea sp. TBR-22]
MKHVLAAAVLGALISSGVAQAAPLQGQFRIDGSDYDVRVGLDYIDFGPFLPITTGRFEVTTATLDFAGLDEGTIKDLIALGVGSVMLDDFVEFDGKEAWNFTLTDIYPGVGTPAGCNNTPGSLCTPLLPPTFEPSPFTLLNLNPNGSSVSLSVGGYVTNELGEVSLWSGKFTSQLDQLSSGQALGRILDDEFGYVQSSWSAEFTVTPDDTPVPEPASMILTGLAMSAMAVVLRRRR